MRVAHYLVRGSSGLFYVRIRVPKDLRVAMGATVIKRATGSRCARVALACALTLQARYAQAFTAMRRGEPMAKPPSLSEIFANLSEAGGRHLEYVVERGPHGFRIEADGPEDHARAMEALENIGVIDPYPSAPPPPPAARAPSAPTKEMGAALKMWEAKLPVDTPGKLKNSRALVSKVREFQVWKEACPASEVSQGLPLANLPPKLLVFHPLTRENNRKSL